MKLRSRINEMFTPEFLDELYDLFRQHKFYVKGKDGKELSVDGDFGSNTEYAVKKLQKDLKLTADGIVGTGTVSAIIKKLN